jgi:hypothetical protein
MDSDEEEYLEALRRGEEESRLYARECRLVGRTVFLRLESGAELKFDTASAPALRNAPIESLKSVTLVLDGAGLQFPMLNDLTYYIPALTRGVYGDAESTGTNNLAGA